MDSVDAKSTGPPAFLLELCDCLGALTDPNEVRAKACRLLAEALKASRVTYQEIEDDNSSAASFPDIVGLRAGRTVTIGDLSRPRTDAAAIRDSSGARVTRGGYVAAPIMRSDRLVAVLSVLRARSGEWTATEIKMIESTARRIDEGVARARAERSARRSEERYRTLVASMDEGFCIIETLLDERGTCIDYRFLEVNPAFEHQTGIRDAVGRRMREIAPEHEEFWFETYGRVARTGQAVRFKNYAAEFNRWFNVFAYPVGDKASRQVGILFTDNTLNYQARNALRASEARLATLFDALPDGIGVTDREGRLTVSNKQLQRFLPTNLVPSKDPVARSHWRATTADGVPVAPKDFPVTRALRGDPIPSLEMLFTEFEGREIWTRVTSLPMFDADGVVAGAIVLITDIDALKRSEDVVRKSEERLRTLADAVPPMIWGRQPDGSATYFNQRWHEYTGLTMAESEGAGWEAIIHPDDAPRALRDWQRALAARERFECEYRLRGADGRYRWFLGRSVPLKDERGTVTGWVGSASDVHDLKSAEARLREADVRKNHFLAMLGHELRNPLAAIRNGVSLLRSPKARAESREAALPIVAEQVAHMERLVDDLLDLTRIVQGRLQVHREPMVLQDALNQALEMVRLQAEEEKFILTVDASPDPLRLNGDPVRLTQVFSNLIGNALKYSGASRRIEISAQRSGNEAVVRVRDFGQGIPADLRSRIFEPFFQATPGLTLKSGLGLGLSVVRQLVHLHQGDVAAFSAGDNGGSEFVVRLPLLPTLDEDSPC